MYTKERLLQNLNQLKIDRSGTLLVHSSYKSIGPVEGGPETILDAFSEYMRDGLLVMPTHTWAYINKDNPKFDVERSPSCVGILTELFRRRPGVCRSLHPTHSVAALGKEAAAFTAGDERFDTPCARGSSWGKLLDRGAAIMLLGVDLSRNTFIHGVEEWLDIPGRIADQHKPLYTVLADGTEIYSPVRGHTNSKCWDNYPKVDRVMESQGAMYRGKFGDAEVRICDTVKMTSVLNAMLRSNPDLFSTNDPL